MKQGLVEVLAILDKSAEAAKSSAQAISAYNNLITGLKDADVTWTTILFSSSAEKPHNRVPVKNVKKLVKKDFATSGKAALIDTIGKAIDELGVALSGTPEDNRPSKIIVFIGTAGVDTASKKYTLDEIRQKVDHQRAVYNWEFQFPCADVSAFRQ